MQSDLVVALNKLRPFAGGRLFGAFVSGGVVPLPVGGVLAEGDGIGAVAAAMDLLHDVLAKDHAWRSTALAIGFSASATVIRSVPWV